MHQTLKLNQSKCSSFKKQTKLNRFCQALRSTIWLFVLEGPFTLAFIKDSGSLKY